MSLILTELEDDIGTIVFNNPAKRNAISHDFIEAIIEALGEMRARKARAIVLRALKGSTVWSAGHDIEELPNAGRDPLGWGDGLRILVRAIQTFPAPVIALIEGGVWGGACEVAMACDILVATPDVTFAITPAKLGIPYNLSGLLTLINAVPLPVAKEMLFTAQPIPSAQAFNLGVINYIKSADEIEAFVETLTRAHRRQRAAEHHRDEGGDQAARQRAFGNAGAVRADSGPAPYRLRQPRLPGGARRLSGKAQAAIQRRVVKQRLALRQCRNVT